MKITDWPDKENFIYKECVIGGEKCFLITPQHIGCKWNNNNLIFRSSIWTESGNLISAGFKKFFNYGEAPHLVPDPTELDGTAIEKIDGSLLIVSMYNGELIVRTRGTVDATQLDNGYEIEYLKKKYPRLFKSIGLNEQKVSILCEWTTPNNKIVLDYGEDIELHLVGVISHFNYSYLPQKHLDECAEIWEVGRPKTLTFNSFPELLESTRALKGQEGICYYFNNGQDIKKIKCLDYLAKHAFKSNISYENVLELFIQLEYPFPDQFFHYLETNFDYEIAEFAMPTYREVYRNYQSFGWAVQKIRDIVFTIKGIDRKTAALFIQEKVEKQYWAIAFNMLDGKEITNEQAKKYLLKMKK